MNNRGFTILELLVATAIMAGMSGVFLATLRMNQQSWETSQSYLTVSGELRRGINEMSQELASSRLDQIGGVPADGVWYDEITFAVPEDLDGDGTVLDASGDMEWSNPITYSTVAEQALREQDGSDDRVMANGVQVLEFKREPGALLEEIIEIRMTVERAADTGDFSNQAVLSTRVRLRN